MIILSDLTIPKDQLNEIKGLGDYSIRCLLSNLIDYVTDDYVEEFDGGNHTSVKFDNWINSLTKSQIIKVSHYVLSVLDYLTEEN